MVDPLGKNELIKLFEYSDVEKLSKMAARSGLILSEDFVNMDLTFKNFSNDNLTGVNFTNTDLRGAKFINTNLTDAIFDNADVTLAVFCDNEGMTKDMKAYLLSGGAMFLEDFEWNQ